MEKNVDSETQSEIVTKTSQLLNSLDAIEAEFLEKTSSLKKKEDYSKNLLKCELQWENTIEEKRVELANIEHRTRLINMGNSIHREKAILIHQSHITSDRLIKNNESTLEKLKSEVAATEQKMKQRNERYQMQMGELINSLNRITESRNNNQKYAEEKDQELSQENLNIKSQLKVFDAASAEDFEEDVDIEAMENELKDIQKKLSILNEFYENYEVEMASEGESEESLLNDIKIKLEEIKRESSHVASNVEDQVMSEKKLKISYQTLIDYEKKLDESLGQSPEELLTKYPSKGFLKLEQEINLIKADILARSEKYSVTCIENEKLSKKIEQNMAQIAEKNDAVEQLNDEITKVESVLSSVETPETLIKKFTNASSELDTIYAQKTLLQETIRDKETTIHEHVALLRNANDKANSDLMLLKSNQLVEQGSVEKSLNDTQSVVNALEEDVKLQDEQLATSKVTLQTLEEQVKNIKTEHCNLGQEITKNLQLTKK